MTPSPRKSLSIAVLVALGAASGTACAVYQDPGGVGQALVYPYYTVQTAGGNAFNTYLSVANTTTRAKAVKVRFSEGKNSRPVMDFNLYLSPNDVWTAALGPADATPASPALMITADKSCTAPPIPAAGVAFRNYAYVGARGDGGATTLDSTREGYFEIIEMANLGGAAAIAVTHTPSGSPANCAFVQPDAGFNAASNGAFLQRPSGGLTGTYTLINVANGLNFGGNATALSQFSSTPIFADIGDDAPNLGSASPPVAMVAANVLTGASGPGTTLYMGTFANGRDAVSATMMRATLVNEFALDVATRSSTDWVLTFPTKHLYVGTGTGAAVAPFSVNFGATGSCEPLGIIAFNREESQSESNLCQICGIPPPGPPAASACWAASVLSITSGPSPNTPSSVLGSVNSTDVNTQGRQNGMVWLSFSGAAPASTGLSSVPGSANVQNIDTGATAANATMSQRGLPVIGFMARTLNNGALSCTTFSNTPGLCAGAYGAAFEHKYMLIAIPTP